MDVPTITDRCSLALLLGTQSGVLASIPEKWLQESTAYMPLKKTHGDLYSQLYNLQRALFAYCFIYCRHLVHEAHALGVSTIIDRCNLTVLLEPGQEDLPAFLAEHKVTVVASLPCYTADNVDKQRGRNVFERSIKVGVL